MKFDRLTGIPCMVKSDGLDNWWLIYHCCNRHLIKYLTFFLLLNCLKLPINFDRLLNFGLKIFCNKNTCHKETIICLNILIFCVLMYRIKEY